MKKKITSLFIITLLSLSQAFPVFASENIIDTETEYATEIEWDKPATWEVTIPELSMDALSATGTGTVSVIADLLGNSFLKVTASPTVTMTQEGKPEVIADVTLTKNKMVCTRSSSRSCYVNRQHGCQNTAIGRYLHRYSILYG